MVAMTLADLWVRAVAGRTLAGAATPGPQLWYLTRTTAEAAYITLTLAVALGLLRSIATTARERLSWVFDELHAFIATLAGLFVLGHLATIALDSYVPFTLKNILVPGPEPYRAPLAINLGIFAMYAMALILLSSWLRRFIPHRLWRLIHYASFVAFVLVTIHGWFVGSDVNEPWQRAIYGGAVAGIGFLVLMRLLPPRAARQALAPDR